MKHLFYTLIIALLILIIYSCGSDKPDKRPSSNQRKKQTEKVEEKEESDLLENTGLPIDSDSAKIIFTGGTEKDHQYVFIDKRKKSDYYPLITDFELPSKFEISQYRNSYSAILKSLTENPIKNYYNTSLENNWLSLKFYDSEYYVYCPAREEENYRFRLTDSSIIVFDYYGVNAEKISGFKKENDKHFILNTVCVSDEGKLISKESNIYLIDSKKQIYIWETFAPGGLTYRLMIPAKYAKSFPIIINYGEKSRPEEYKFEEINYFEEISKLI
jgi:hypothetical protein